MGRAPEVVPQAPFIAVESPTIARKNISGSTRSNRRGLLGGTSVPTPTNPLGVKGAGEAGTVGSLSAGVNAIVDALSVLGIRHIDTPCTPYRVWQAIADAGGGGTRPSAR
jgi:hypothetical protein